MAEPSSKERRAARPSSKWRRVLVGLTGPLLLVVVVIVAWRMGDARRFAELVREARPEWLAVAAVLQIGTYVCAGSIWRICLRGACSPRLRRLVFLSVAKLFTDQALPSGGIAGTTLLMRAVVRRGTPLGVATAALVVNLIGFYGAFAAATITSLVLLGALHAGTVLIAMSAALLALAAVVLATLIFLLRGGDLPAFVKRIKAVRTLLEGFAQAPRERLRDPLSLGASFVLQLVTIALDAGTLMATLAAVGVSAPLAGVFAAFVFAMVAEVVGMVPGGMGTFEGTCVAMLTFEGVALEPALAATLLLRGLTFWLPMLPGVALAHRELVSLGERSRRSGRHAAPATASAGMARRMKGSRA